MKRLIILFTALGIALANPASAFAPIHKQIAIKKVAFKSVFQPKAFALALLKNKSEFGCLVTLWNHESHWNYKADNPTSTAYGIAQMLGEKSKVASVQVFHGIRYIEARYSGSPCLALGHFHRMNWY